MRKQNKTGREMPLPTLRVVGGEGSMGEGARKLCTQGLPPAPTHTPQICTVQTPDNYNSQIGGERGSQVGSEVGKARKGHRDKISHIYNFYISINLAPAGCM